MNSKNKQKEGNNANSASDKNQLIGEFLGELVEQFLSKHDLTLEDLKDYISKKPAPNTIPVSIFKNDKLSALEAIVKYLKENKNLKYSQIAKLLNRDQRTIWATYNKASKKLSSPLSAKSDYHIPIEMLKDRKLSTLENIVSYLKEHYKLSNHEIAVLLNRNDRTIWTVYNRATRKLKLSGVENKFSTKNKRGVE